MTDAREIIARQIPGTSAEVCFGVAEGIIDALNAAGYRVIGPDEVDPVTVEKALVAVNEIAQRGYSAAYRGGASDCDAAIRALGRKV